MHLFATAPDWDSLADLESVPCLSLKRHWAWAVVHGPKRIENRSWTTRYRGPMLVHASRSECRQERDALNQWCPLPEYDDLSFGSLVGLVLLTDCVPLAAAPAGPFAEGPQCWLLDDPRPIAPVPFIGRQGLFRVPMAAICDRLTF